MDSLDLSVDMVLHPGVSYEMMRVKYEALEGLGEEMRRGWEILCESCSGEWRGDGGRDDEDSLCGGSSEGSHGV